MHDAIPLPTGVEASDGRATPAVGAGVDPLAVRRAADRFTRFVDAVTAGTVEAPLPGGGRTSARFDVLSAVAEDDLCAARLAEGHLDAVAILAELEDGDPVAPGQYWGVWAAEPPGSGLTATRGPDGWVLNGLKQYCSGAHSCTHALVTATAEDGRRLFAVRTGIPEAVRTTTPETEAGATGPGCRPVSGTWRAIGMAGSDSPDIRFTDVPATAVGGVEAYLRRPGFHHGGVGVAACWYGGARAVAHVLFTRAEQRADPFTDAHAGAVDLRLYTAGTVLRRAAEEIDLDPLDKAGAAGLRALRVRAVVAEVCSEVLDHVGRATGAGPLCRDERHARAVTDLGVYVRQHHAERDLAALGRLVARGPEEGR
ncbi:acyl-CoA dehydrogenase [Streptomyces sp. ISL-112]|uniref:acyl-CoA dehydrogenase n=1 Tax=unclassified Streptomyces TaxID=2593676 RepID=UPI001BE92AF1|nr:MULTISPECIES: acyl-CoA dehydrogenase [unclassified Streptomyces]MBT2427322.1 acyl-CoA dehydrogenase [Streptomyces sp. ISL-112]MBT2464357.1 acyl-CoA dehydrogenase [Streptomyces sp. ISL-63]